METPFQHAVRTGNVDEAYAIAALMQRGDDLLKLWKSAADYASLDMIYMLLKQRESVFRRVVSFAEVWKTFNGYPANLPTLLGIACKIVKTDVVQEHFDNPYFQVAVLALQQPRLQVHAFYVLHTYYIIYDIVPYGELFRDLSADVVTALCTHVQDQAFQQAFLENWLLSGCVQDTAALGGKVRQWLEVQPVPKPLLLSQMIAKTVSYLEECKFIGAGTYACVFGNGTEVVKVMFRIAQAVAERALMATLIDLQRFYAVKYCTVRVIDMHTVIRIPADKQGCAKHFGAFACGIRMENGGESLYTTTTMSEPFKALFALAQLASAVNVLNQNNIYHNDITDANVLMTSTTRYVLIDFGMSAHANTSLFNKTTSTSPLQSWMPWRFWQLYVLACIGAKNVVGAEHDVVAQKAAERFGRLFDMVLRVRTDVAAWKDAAARFVRHNTGKRVSDVEQQFAPHVDAHALAVLAVVVLANKTPLGMDAPIVATLVARMILSPTPQPVGNLVCALQAVQNVPRLAGIPNGSLLLDPVISDGNTCVLKVQVTIAQNTSEPHLLVLFTDAEAFQAESDIADKLPTDDAIVAAGTLKLQRRHTTVRLSHKAWRLCPRTARHANDPLYALEYDWPGTAVVNVMETYSPKEVCDALVGFLHAIARLNAAGLYNCTLQPSNVYAYQRDGTLALRMGRWPRSTTKIPDAAGCETYLAAWRANGGTWVPRYEGDPVEIMTSLDRCAVVWVAVHMAATSGADAGAVVTFQANTLALPTMPDAETICRCIRTLFSDM